MIQLPESGFRRSVTKSNINPNALADWLEAVVLFEGEPVSKSDVVDVLVEYDVCPDGAQDLAHLIADSGWHELQKRKDWGGLPASFTIGSTRIEDVIEWEDDPIRSFFLLLSILRIFPDWAKGQVDHVAQGNLFEKVVETICPAMLPGWHVFRAGWSPEDAQDIPAIITELSNRINVKGAVDPYEYVAPDARDAGLDIVCYRPFGDTREALPVYLLQCASGKNWRQKVHTPNAHVWQKLLDSAVQPSTGIAAPFVIDTPEMKRAALEGQITILDRIRMLRAASDAEVTLSDDTLAEVIDWLAPRIEALPRFA